jgi:hypothetical protein
VTSLSIVIVSYNARPHLEDCLESLTTSPPATPHEIVVVDNASTDGSVAAVQRRWPAVTIIPQSVNAGFAAGNNVGIRASNGALILLLNNDTIVPPGAVDTLVAALLARPDAAVAGPRLSFGRMISPLNELRQKLTLTLYRRGMAGVSSWIERETASERDVDWVSGACLLVRRADADKAGLLDERYFLYTEDVDFCAAIRRMGRRVIFTPRTHVIHLIGRSRATSVSASNLAYRRSQLAFYEKHHPGWVPLLRAYLRMKRQLPR